MKGIFRDSTGVSLKDRNFPLVMTDVFRSLLIFPKSQEPVISRHEFDEARTHHEGDADVNDKDSEIVFAEAQTKNASDEQIHGENDHAEHSPWKDCETHAPGICDDQGFKVFLLSLIDAHIHLIHRSQEREEQKK